MGQSSDTLVKGDLAQRFLAEARAQGWRPDHHDMEQIVFRTRDKELYEYLGKIAYKNHRAGLGFSFYDAETDQSYAMPYQVLIYRPPEDEILEKISAFQALWDAKSGAGDALNYEWRIQTEGQFPKKIDKSSLTPDQQRLLLKQIGEMGQHLRDFTGDEGMFFHIMSNFERIGSRHVPTHAYPVINQTWLNDGTIFMDDDGNDINQAYEGEEFFMLPGTHHRPIDVKPDQDGQLKPRLSLIINGLG